MYAVETHKGDQIDFGFVWFVDASVEVQCVRMQLWQELPVAVTDGSLVGKDGSADIEVDKEEDPATGRVELLVVGEGICIEEGGCRGGDVLCEVYDDRKSDRVQKYQGMAVGIILQVWHSLEYVFQLKNAPKHTQTRKPEELDQGKHKVCKCVKVATVDKHILEFLGETCFQVAQEEDQLTVTADTSHQGPTNFSEQVRIDLEAVPMYDFVLHSRHVGRIV